MAPLPLLIGAFGPPELLILFALILLLFGASKLPKLARSMGQATGEFQKGREEVERELEDMQMNHEDPEADPEPEATE